ncbi:tRNA-splicing endonuclease subunit Sen15 [Silurus asotus]|uniref:tRNA-splicing endonuclease subunit Sen15 n=1 Tax=Silurus asotus TaxID=30991 RepID=A0AAD5FDA1_SILAS|nr:tRNA-splicing endonuclease subunit Sen15 [Silurus asotus]
MLLTFHTYHRQATVGPCDTTDPCHPTALSKIEWAAWKALGDMSKEEAMKAYVEEILLILEMIPVTEEVCDLLKVLEPFYEVVEDEDEDKDDDTTSKPAMSTFSGGDDVSEPEEPSEVYSDLGSGGLQAAAAPAKELEGRGPWTEGCESAGDSLAPVVTSMKVGEDLVNTQIVVALSRLQDDMRSVLAKLDTLEARAMSQVERFDLRSQTRTALDNKRRPVCQISAAFLLTWPFVAHFLVQLYLQKKRQSAITYTRVWRVTARDLKTTNKQELMDEEKREAPSNWITQHPVYRDLLKLGVEDDAQVYGAFLVYLDLTEVRRWTSVSAVPCPDLKAVLLEGRERDGEGLRVVFPLPAHRNVSHRDLRCIVGRGTPMLLCAVASDSTLVYQQLSDGLVTPDPPVDIRDLGRRQHRKRRVQT